MGIKDEDYANALEHQRLHERALMQLELEKQKEEARMARTNGTGTVHISHGGTTTTFTGTGTSINPYTTNATTGTFTPVGIKTLNEKDLQHDAMKAPLSALVDMWTMRWQDTWVNEGDFDEDDFWRLALVRLLGASKLEKHNLADQHRSVYRIIE